MNYLSEDFITDSGIITRLDQTMDLLLAGGLVKVHLHFVDKHMSIYLLLFHFPTVVLGLATISVLVIMTLAAEVEVTIKEHLVLSATRGLNSKFNRIEVHLNLLR